MTANKNLPVYITLLAILFATVPAAEAQSHHYGGGGRHGGLAEGGNPMLGDGSGGSGELSGGSPTLGGASGSGSQGNGDLSSNSERIAEQLARGKKHPAAAATPHATPTPAVQKPESRTIKNNSDMATF